MFEKEKFPSIVTKSPMLRLAEPKSWKNGLAFAPVVATSVGPNWMASVLPATVIVSSIGWVVVLIRTPTVPPAEKPPPPTFTFPESTPATPPEPGLTGSVGRITKAPSPSVIPVPPNVSSTPVAAMRVIVRLSRS